MQEWIVLFKGFQVHFNVERKALIEVLLPLTTSPCVLVSILCNFVAIRMNVNPTIRISLAVASVAVMTPFCLLLYLYGKLTELQETAIRRKRCELTSRVNRRSLKCLQIQSYLLGPFCKIERLLTFDIILFVINMTITLLITFP